MTAGSASPPVAYDDAPLRAFHLRVAVASFGGVFSDGFGLGIIGIVLGLATAELRLTPVWLGLLGGASLAGLFLGALLTGPVADRIGRRPVYAANMVLLAAASAAQFFVASGPELLVLRLAVGFLLGSDYVVSKALLIELTPAIFRGRTLSTLSVAWAGGYACAYFIGYAITGSHPDGWRWMLLASAVPCLAVAPFRLTLPESPLWLAAQGRFAEAARIVREHLGPGVAPPAATPAPARRAGRWRELLAPAWRRRTLVGCAFFTCQVIPYFAVGTFAARVISALHVESGYLGGVFYNAALLLGAALGLVVVDRIQRRTFLIGSFAVTAAAMLILTVADDLPAVAIIGLFAVFAGVLSAATNLVYVYLPELFPTDLRASGIGLAIAASRIGSATSTFLLPVVVATFGVRTALGGCFAVLVIGGVICQRWAPETRGVRLGVATA